MVLYRVALSSFHTGLLRIEPLALAHAGPMFEMADRPRFNDFLLWKRPADVGEVQRLVEGWIARRATGKHASFAMFDRASGQFAGRLALTIVPEFPEWVAMTCELHPAFWGGAHALEATHWMQWVIFERLDAAVALAYSFEPNVRARRFLTDKAELHELPLEPCAPSWMPARPDRLVTHVNTRKRWRVQAQAYGLAAHEIGATEARPIVPAPAVPDETDGHRIALDWRAIVGG